MTERESFDSKPGAEASAELRAIQRTLHRRLWHLSARAFVHERQGTLVVAATVALFFVLGAQWSYFVAMLLSCVLLAVPTLLRGGARLQTLSLALSELGSAQAQLVVVGASPRSLLVGGRWVFCEDTLTALTLDAPTLHAAGLHHDVEQHTTTLGLESTVLGLGKRTHRKREVFVAAWPSSITTQHAKLALDAAARHVARWVPSATSAGDQPLNCVHQAEVRRLLAPSNAPRLLAQFFGLALILPSIIVVVSSAAVALPTTPSPRVMLLFVVLPTAVALLFGVVVGANRWLTLRGNLLKLLQQPPCHALICPEHGFVYFTTHAYFSERTGTLHRYTGFGYKPLSLSYDAAAHRLELRDKEYVGGGVWARSCLQFSLDPAISPTAAREAANEVTHWMQTA